MPEYGLTRRGPNIKRLDTIIEEMHSDISEGWGVNTRQNPQSLINVLITDIADKIAELWEFGEQLYYSQYPSTAEGVNLDNAAQYGGSTRELPARSYYRILCTGLDGTEIPAGTMIASDTSPRTNLVLPEAARITRESFNRAAVTATQPWNPNTAMGIAVNGTLWTKEPDPEKSAEENLKALAAVIKDPDFRVTAEGDTLVLEALDPVSSSSLVLSENLTTASVGSVIMFATEEDGDIYLPPGVVSVIVKSAAGLESVENVGEYIAGRLEETDSEFRQSYADKIFNRSSTMIESIQSAILKNVQGVTTCSVYENCGDDIDEKGRWPHSVEVVADGGDPAEIARQIFDTKAGGINTFGSVEVELPGLYGEKIPVRFNRPVNVYVWFRVEVTMSRTANLPVNYLEIIKTQLIDGVKALKAGEDVVPQTFLPKVPGADYLDISLFATPDAGQPAGEYALRSVSIDERERAVTDEGRIEVVLDD